MHVHTPVTFKAKDSDSTTEWVEMEDWKAEAYKNEMREALKECKNARGQETAVVEETYQMTNPPILSVCRRGHFASFISPPTTFRQEMTTERLTTYSIARYVVPRRSWTHKRSPTSSSLVQSGDHPTRERL